MAGANISGKSVITSTTSTVRMFAFRRLLAALGHDRLREADDPYVRAVRLLERGDAPAAEAALTRLLETAATPEERARILNKRGVAHVALKRRDDAVRDFTLALESQPRYAPTLTNVGNLLLEEGVLDDAVAHYEAAIRSDETYAVAHLNLSVAYRKAGKRADAVRELRTAHRLEGRSVWRRTVR